MFDIAIGISAQSLNATSQSLYAVLYPNLFQGSQNVTYQGQSYTVAFDITAAPQFDLSTPVSTTIRKQVMLQKAEIHGMLEQFKAIRNIEGLLASAPSFSLNFPTVNINLSGGVNVSLTLQLTAYCSIQIIGNIISFNVSSVTTSTTFNNSVEEYLINNILLPQIETIAQNLFQGITIPPISVANINLSTPSVGIVNNYVIAAVNLNQSGPPVPPDDSITWPTTPFFAMLGPNIIQAAMNNIMASSNNQFTGSGSTGDEWAGSSYSYDIYVSGASTSINGTSIIANLGQILGSITAGISFLCAPTTLNFDAMATPNPTITFGVNITGNAVSLVTQNVSTFVVLVAPGNGDVVEQIIEFLVTPIINTIGTTATATIASFLNGISMPAFTIPTYSVSVSGITLTLTPTGLQPSNVSGFLTLGGNLSIT